MKGAYSWGNVRSIFPEFIARCLEEGITEFGKKIPGYDRDDAVLSGVESRTSSPVRILRDETLQSSVKGLYPCGEGAGYAGGITKWQKLSVKNTWLSTILRMFKNFLRV